MTFHVPNKYRFRAKGQPLGTDDSSGNNGFFVIPIEGPNGHDIQLRCIASDGADWEHVSVSLPNRCPTWNEMCLIKMLFWDDSDLVVQFHPPASEYVNCHPFCLHLWRKAGTNDFVTLPDSSLVGPKNARV